MHGSISLAQLQGQVQPFRARGWELFEAVLSRTFGGRGRDKSKITSVCFCELHHFSRGLQDGSGLRTCGKVLLKQVPATVEVITKLTSTH